MNGGLTVRGATAGRSYTNFIPPAAVMPKGLENRSDKYCLDWRWLKAKELSDETKRGREPLISRRDDPLVVEHIKPYLDKYGPHPVQTDIEEEPFSVGMIEPEFEAIHWANKLSVSKDNETFRYMLEAFLCSEATIEQISEQLLIPPSHVWWYGKMFLDVEGIIDNPCRVNADILFSTRSVIPKVQDFFWKAVAWKHGLGMEGFKHLVHPSYGLSQQALSLLRDIIEFKMAADTMQALHTRNINSYNENLVIDQFQRTLEISSKSEDRGGSSNANEVGMVEFLGQFANHIGVAKHTTEFKGYEGITGPEPAGNIFEQRRKEAANIEGETE